MATALVTGGAGFIGSHLVERLMSGRAGRSASSTIFRPDWPRTSTCPAAGPNCYKARSSTPMSLPRAVQRCRCDLSPWGVGLGRTLR